MPTKTAVKIFEFSILQSIQVVKGVTVVLIRLLLNVWKNVRASLASDLGRRRGRLGAGRRGNLE